ncbi:N-acetylmuramoyl-L-alanine amidase [Vallitalea pronyensis]|uniref:N-acetylmuramoyl-L-alanine amidase n=1 Tax=Vallitalea pronyensis TaxID=1348613 RepID=A0A8J8MPF0_9FIRM|nr:peptidoglycan recognition family protein [Vallitalea pronyensis]QUI25500.1 N-acetylmuramoyl-L-alanine amidase [Vallitalea pronyensis]
MNIIKTQLNINVPSNNRPAYIIIHHALAPRCSIDDIHGWHLNRGFAGFGYHYFINKEGKIYRGRMETQRGSHCKQEGMNMKSIGICLEGCYQDYQGNGDKVVPDAQLEALKNLTLYLMKKYKIKQERIKKHHDFVQYKLCPGNYFPWEKYMGLVAESTDAGQIKALIKENQYYKEEIEKLQERLGGIKKKIYEIERMVEDE